MPTEPKYKFLPDKPLTSLDDDIFGHDDFVDVLLQIVQGCETPCNIGLFGKWGSGKTSIINFLSDRIKIQAQLSDKYELLYIDAWKLNKDNFKRDMLVTLNSFYKRYDTEQIEDTLYNIKESDFSEEISEREKIIKLLKNNKLYWIIIALTLVYYYILLFVNDLVLANSVLTFILVPLSWILLKEINSVTSAVRSSYKRIVTRVESPLQFETIFSEIMSLRGKKTAIIVIDNLDRTESEVVVDVFGTIKNFMDVEGIIFIIACDEGALIKHLQCVKGHEYEPSDAVEFLRKFFQTSITIPPFLNEKLDDYINSQMAHTKVPFDNGIRTILTNISRKNPRRVKQFLNKLVAMYILSEKREDEKIISRGVITENTAFLAKITYIKEEWPILFDQISRDSTLLKKIEDDLTVSDNKVNYA